MTYVYYACECGFRTKVVGTWEELRDMSLRNFGCPWCDRELSGAPSRVLGKGDYFELSFDEFMYAVNGLGLPNETVTQIEPVVALLKSSPIVDVKAFEVAERCVITELVLKCGVTLHFAASGYGAVVFKATREKDASYRTSNIDYGEQVRRQGDAEEHCSRGCGGSSVCCQVHGRVREDANAFRDPDWWKRLPPPRHCVGKIEGSAEVVQRPDDGEVGSSSEEEGDKEAQGQGG